MENREISLLNLIYEFKRKIGIILVVGLIIGAAMAAVYFVKGRSAVAVNQYGSQCGIRTTDASEAYGGSASAEKNKGIILSDEVLNSVCEEYNNAHKGEEALTIDEMRASTYPIISDDGNMVKLYSVTSNQEKAQAINELTAKYAVAGLNNDGVDAKLIQKTRNMGTVTVSQAEDMGQVDRWKYSVSSTPAIGFSMTSVIKKGLIGFIIGIILAYVCVCVAYIVRGKVVYPNEIKDANLELLGVLGKADEANKYCWKNAISCILLEGKPIRKALLLSCGCELDYKELKATWSDEGVELIEGDDILKNPMAKLKAKEVDTSVIVVKSDKIKLDELYSLGKELKEGANGVAGAILMK